MTDFALDLLAGIVGPCPTCHSGRLTAVFDGEGTNLFCEPCGSCWRPELGWIRRVDPRLCPGCASRERCVEAWRVAVPVTG